MGGRKWKLELLIFTDYLRSKHGTVSDANALWKTNWRVKVTCQKLQFQ